MVDPRLKPVPETATASEKAEIFARDLAYGAEIEDWTSTFAIYLEDRYNHYTNDDNGDVINQKLATYFESKWNDRPPKLSNMLAYDFLEMAMGEDFRLTDKARELLKKPTEAPRIFISYRRAESSAFALLVEARFKIVGNSQVFIDKNLRGGDAWHARLNAEVEGSKYFICLMGPTTLDSDYVRSEIEWAHKAGCYIVSVCHNGYTLDAAGAAMPELAVRHGHEIKGDAAKASASDYEAAANFVLNSCGYSTY